MGRKGPNLSDGTGRSHLPLRGKLGWMTPGPVTPRPDHRNATFGEGDPKRPPLLFSKFQTPPFFKPRAGAPKERGFVSDLLSCLAPPNRKSHAVELPYLSTFQLTSSVSSGRFQLLTSARMLPKATKRKTALRLCFIVLVLSFTAIGRHGTCHEARGSQSS